MSMATAPHRVRRLAFAVSGVGDAGAALDWRRALHDGLDTTLRPVLDGALADAAARAKLGERMWHLPRLHLRVRAREPQALVEALREAVEAALADQLAPDAVAAPALRTAAERAAAAFAAYVVSGRMPWHDDEADAAVVARLLRAEALDALDRVLASSTWPTPWVERAAREGAASPMLQRWAALLDAPAIERLRVAVAALREPEATVPAPNDARGASEAARLLWRVWMRHALAAPAKAIVASESKSVSSPAAEHRAKPPPAPVAPLANAAQPRAQERTASRAESATTDDAAPEPATWWARDAGLVLLHPYLPTLLRATGCLADEEDDALRPEQIPRAVALLHALATGRDEAFEFELTLAKLLLGLAPDAPLPPGPIAIDAAARAEGDGLLAAAIDHWPALGRTSIDGFRQTFLARDGVLSRRDDGWHLRIADEPFDLLLGRLPWGIGLVRLPWMDAPLHVHWGAWGA